MPSRFLVPTVLIALALPASAADPTPKFGKDQVAFYEKDVKPLLQKHCFKCHGDGDKIKGGLSLSTRAAALAGGDTGAVVDLKSHEKSLLLLAITNKRPDGGEVMPPTGKLPDADIATLTKWVKEQLPYSAADLGTTEPAQPEKSIITEEAKKYWAYQPLVRPTVPDIRNPKTVTRNPIDAFIRSKLTEKGLEPNGPAEKVALVRRLYFDLLGLPPTPEQVDEFVKDASPKAYEALVDRLLASPHYGEKWGRHWLDVVRYAETNGYERDGPKPFAWRYRDYVIRSFNADKPYDRFVREQIAGDELPGDSADAIVATGYYRLGLWDDEPADAKQALFDGYDDLVTVTAQGFLAMTVNCARCHDHKKDPILQADYYRLLAFFRDIRPYSDNRDVRSSANMTDITPIEKRRTYEGELNERKKKLADLAKEMEAIEDAAIKTMPAEDQRASEGPDRPQVVAKLNKFFTDRQKRDYYRLKRDYDDLQRRPMPSQELALSVNNCDPRPPTVYVLARGNPHAPKEKEPCAPGFPTVLGVPDPAIAPAKGKSSGRRTVLADWIASKNNPLTARVMVNRIWQHHFGRGIVPSPSDFGKLGEPSTHPELLDWLASEFQEPTAGQPWSVPGAAWTMKRLHKLILLSDTYRMASTGNAKNLAVDPANNLFWRFNMRRLVAEEVRDSILSVSGKLKLDQFGPSVYPKIPQEVLAGQSVPGQGWLKSKGGGYDPREPDAGNRRSVYVSVKRSLQVPVLINHDQADTDSSCPVRYTTTVPTQALGMLNGEFTNEMAVAFAKRLTAEAPGDLAKRVERAIRLTTGRVPTPSEIAADVAFVEKLKTDHKLSDEPALTRYALLLLNANEFVYLD